MIYTQGNHRKYSNQNEVHNDKKENTKRAKNSM